MRVEEISNVEALLFLVAVAAAASIVWQLIPGERRTSPAPDFADEDVTAYDRALPKYGVVALGALVVAGAHAALKSLPGVHAWLADGGHGGHLVRDIANTHLMIVMGGTVAATGVTWYVLPRILGRPLWNERLAGASFWCTVIGAAGFYVVNVVTGVVGAVAAHEGTGWYETNEALGAWRTVPVGLSATVMGIGYWTFVADVIATVVASRRLARRGPDTHLAKWFVVGAAGLLVGTVQGVVQVMPDQERWLHRAGSAGEYIDPIAHAHVNLVTGSLVLAAGAVMWWTRDPDRADRQRRVEQRIFWLLVPASVAFYATFMTLGFVEGGIMVRDGVGFLEAVERVGAWHSVTLAVVGSLVLAGIAALVVTLVGRVRRRPSPVAGLVTAAMVLLAVGSSHGLVQLVPPVKRWLERIGQHGDAIANAHAQLNMLGGVVLTLLALLVLAPGVLIGAPVAGSALRRTTRRAVAGIGVYYVGALVTAVTAGWAYLRPDVASGGPLETVIGPAAMATGAALSTAGFAVLAGHAWRSSAAYRRAGLHRAHQALAVDAGARPRWTGHVPWPTFALVELVGAAAGFPGFGWILSGNGVVGLPLALAGPGVAWGLIPALLSAGSPATAFHGPATYLAVSAVVSAAALAVRLARVERRWSGP